MADPDGVERVRFNCEGCDKRIKAKKGMEGKNFRCPFCGYLSTVPYGKHQTISDSLKRKKEKQKNVTDEGFSREIQALASDTRRKGQPGSKSRSKMSLIVVGLIVAAVIAAIVYFVV